MFCLYVKYFSMIFFLINLLYLMSHSKNYIYEINSFFLREINAIKLISLWLLFYQNPKKKVSHTQISSYYLLLEHDSRIWCYFKHVLQFLFSAYLSTLSLQNLATFGKDIANFAHLDPLVSRRKSGQRDREVPGMHHQYWLLLARFLFACRSK